jgi:formiminoglutamate deiminase
VSARRYHAELAWLGQVAEMALIEVEGDRIVRVTPGAEAPPDAVRLPGFTIPGLANAHSHAFQRALRGRTQAGWGDFWAWRERMYEVAGRLDPDAYLALARAVYAEMALAGVTAVGEFHYLHHDPDGRPYADANAMGHALMAAAREAGIRITLLDCCYLAGGLEGQPLESVQRRYGDGDVGRWAERATLLRDGQGVRIGAAIHSVRAVPPAAIEAVAAWALARGAPLHFHLSEQQGENEACLRATGLTPAALLRQRGALGAEATAVHATHLTDADVALLGGSKTSVCLCPTTERDLADGVGPAAALVAAGSRLCLGSDSHAVIDLFEEARAVELDQRLASGHRGHHGAGDLLQAATAGGMASLGWDAGRLAAGFLADFAAVSLRSVRTAGSRPEDAAAQVVFAATAADVTDVVVGGRQVVVGGHHLALGDVGELLSHALANL